MSEQDPQPIPSSVPPPPPMAPQGTPPPPPAPNSSASPASSDPTAGIPTGGLLKEEPAPGPLTGDEKLWGLLANLLGLVGAVLALVIQGQSKFVKFNALQVLFLCLFFIPVMIVLGAIMFVLSLVPFFGWILAIFFTMISPLIGLTLFALCIIIAIKAYNGLIVRLPIIGNMAYRNAYGEAPAATPKS